MEAQIPIVRKAHTLGGTGHMSPLAHMSSVKRGFVMSLTEILKNGCSFYSITQWQYF